MNEKNKKEVLAATKAQIAKYGKRPGTDVVSAHLLVILKAARREYKQHSDGSLPLALPLLAG
jgi:hypothetical protein